jgi:1,4-dihydroxy-2-naphthoate octaprenyltransferase
MTGTIVVGNHTHEEILDSLDAIPEVAVCTTAGDHLRARMMHFGADDDFNIYLASMRGDPKTLQLANNPTISLLVLDRRTDQNGWREIEITGRAEVIHDAAERNVALEKTTGPSPIVAHLRANDQVDVLDFIRVTPIEVKMRIFGEIVAGMPPTVVEFEENAGAGNDLAGVWRRISNWRTGVRTISLLASIVPIVLGVTLAWNASGAIDWLRAVLTLVAGVAIQAGTNVFNDYFDHRNGNDAANREFVRPFSGGSRAIQLGLMTPVETLMLGTGLCLLSVIIGVGLALSGSPWVLAFGAIGLVSGVCYTARPLFWAGRGFGEIMVAANYGLLMTLGAYYVQSNTITWTATLASLPVAGLIALVLFINEFPDYNADSRTGKRTLVVRIGRAWAARLYAVLALSPFVVAAVLVATGVAPLPSLACLAGIPLVLSATRIVLQHHSEPFELAPANALTAIAHLTTGLLFALGFAWDELGRDGLPLSIALGVVGIGYIAYMYRSVERQRRIFSGVKGAVGR